MSGTPLYVDFESRSPVELKTAGLARYAKHPMTEPLMMAWAVGDLPIQLWRQGEPLPDAVRAHVLAGGIVVAHNAQFELAIWNFHCAPRLLWPALRIEQTRCTMAASYALALPGALENSAHALGLKVYKDSEGRSLMLKMCKPRGFDGEVPYYHDSPEMRERLALYCMTDVEVEREIYKRVHPLSDAEQHLWYIDQLINLRGIPFDLESLKAALIVADKEKIRLNGEMALVTGGKVTACSALPALKEWAADYGVMPDGLAKAELSEMLLEEYIPEVVKSALRIRQSAGRFTSISKLNAIERRQVNDRVMYTKQYHAATTGRWGGRGIQPDNFTRDLPEPETVEDILGALRREDASYINAAYGEPSTMISKCLRGFIKAAPGKVLMGGDYSNVEGRGIAWLAGEEWKLDAFRLFDAGLGPDLYCVAYSKSFNVPVEKVTKDQRQIGKVQELAFGYQGGEGAFESMAKMFGISVPFEQRTEYKNAWRAAHTMIKTYWYDLQSAAIRAVKYPGQTFQCGARGREVVFGKYGSFLLCNLPSGRRLSYPYPQILPGKYGEMLTFKGVPEQLTWATYSNQHERGEPNTTYIVDDPANAREWCRMSSYGGKLSENITQAICRDILAEAIVRCEAAGFPVVMHIHDEIVVEGEYTDADRERFSKIMSEVPAWATGFPISAGCWLSPRYIKG